MKVVVENNEPDFSRQVQGNPPMFKRRGETEVVVREGERLVIGGVTVENDNPSARCPVLGDIPVLGWLFKSREIASDVAGAHRHHHPDRGPQAGTTARR